MRRRTWCATAALVGVLAGCGADAEDAGPERPGPGLHELTFTSPEEEEEHMYLMYVPPDYDPDTPTPLVFVFHGQPGTAYEIAGTSAMNNVADQEGFLVAYPDDMDIDLTRDLAAALVEDWNVAPGAVYAAGFSAGGSQSLRLGMASSETFAAVASVGGPSYSRDETPDPPVSMLGVIGLADQNWLEPFDEGMQAWREALDCTTGDPTWVDQEGATSRTVASCGDGSEVVEYRVPGMSHRWPSGVEPGQTTGRTIWEFFASHRRD